ncbi:MAG: 5-methyltetrahydropteroyltriglutamate--homocysteine S-methyltransferase, partial [Burkholderiales bacterium]
VPPPFRAEHVGSLLRPAVLKRSFQQYRENRIDAADYEAALTEAIRGAVRTQEEAGLQPITDGEFGRSSWFGFFFERTGGFRLEPSAFQFRDADGGRYEWPTCYACERVRRRDAIAVAEYQRLASLTNRTPKVTLPAPSAFHFFRFHAPADRAVYPDDAAYWDDLVEVFRAEIAALAEAGCRYLQLDEVPLAMLCDPLVREQVKALGGDPGALAAKYVDVLQRILADKPGGMTVGLHLCRGNFRSRWMASGGYEPVAERLFNEVPVDAFFLEYDSERAGDFSPLRYVPTRKRLVLGLISTKRAQLESANELRRRIDEAARYVPMERLALSPQCGFASVAGGNLLTEEQQAAKLRLVAGVADLVWGSR